MNIYIDFDDVICETGRSFADLSKRMFGAQVPYEEMEFFDMQKTFNLTDEQYEAMMIEGHLPETLLAYPETPGASETINRWVEAGHVVSIITGRPFSAFEPSRQWLDNHNLDSVKLVCVNKYGADCFIRNSSFSINLEDFYKMHFDFAVEDSPIAFTHLLHFPECRVAVFNRPWNKKAEFPNEKYKRCFSWDDVDKMLKESAENG